MSQVKLGTSPSPSEGRDAVHVAVVPVQALCTVARGARVRLVQGRHDVAGPCGDGDADGVVDPFMRAKCVKKGEWFWMCLYPETVTSLRHVWEHPRFPESTEGKINLEQVGYEIGQFHTAKMWLVDYVKRNCPYWTEEDASGETGYTRFLEYVKDYKWIYYCGSDCHSLAEVEEPDELFANLSIVLNMRIDANYFETFTCSC